MSLSGWIWSLSNRRDGGRRERALLYLNVYDLTPINKYLYWCGLGIFHSGIEGIVSILLRGSNDVLVYLFSLPGWY